jgi:hypothetical protein
MYSVTCGPSPSATRRRFCRSLTGAYCSRGSVEHGSPTKTSRFGHRRARKRPLVTQECPIGAPLNRSPRSRMSLTGIRSSSLLVRTEASRFTSKWATASGDGAPINNSPKTTGRRGQLQLKSFQGIAVGGVLCVASRSSCIRGTGSRALPSSDGATGAHSLIAVLRGHQIGGLQGRLESIASTLMGKG